MYDKVQAQNLVQPADSVRADQVSRATQTWVDQLMDVGKRNNLLYFRDLKSGTLRLDHAKPEMMSKLHAGNEVKLSALFPGDSHAEALRRAEPFTRRRVNSMRNVAFRPDSSPSASPRGLKTSTSPRHL